jgi:hypothetical protein
MTTYLKAELRPNLNPLFILGTPNRGDYIQVVAGKKPLWLVVQHVFSSAAQCIVVDSQDMLEVPFAAIFNIIPRDYEQ